MRRSYVVPPPDQREIVRGTSRVAAQPGLRSTRATVTANTVLNVNGMRSYRSAFKAMGSPCEIQLFAASHAEMERIAGIAIAEVGRLEARYSRFRSDSFLSEINRVAARGGSISVDEETAGLLNYAATCYHESDGLFDITSGILRRAWRFDRGALPDRAQIQSLLDKVGWHRLRWVPPVLEFPLPGMEIDFGGVVKEYAVDRAATLCYEAGARSGHVNLGGDIKVIGPRPDGGPWRIGIRHPRRPGALIQTVSLHRGGLASSATTSAALCSMVCVTVISSTRKPVGRCATWRRSASSEICVSSRAVPRRLPCSRRTAAQPGWRAWVCPISG